MWRKLSKQDDKPERMKKINSHTTYMDSKLHKLEKWLYAFLTLRISLKFN